MENLKKQLRKMYPEDTDRMIEDLTRYIKKLPKLDYKNPNIYWYKSLKLYVVYPDGIYTHGQKPLQALTNYLPYIRSLNFDAIHILPFLESPMIDKGFDISNYEKIRPDLGSLTDIVRLREKAGELGIKVFMDLVFNHISDQHIWFKKAESGDEYYREFFIYTKEKPKFIKKFHKDAAVWAEYDVNGKKKIVNIAFPEYTGEIPHWRQGKDGYWYYHTYYPQQLDLNWFNPQVFIEMSKIILFWASKGFHFRLDAVPFIGKKAYKDLDTDHERTFTILASVHCLVEEINKECALLVETFETIDTITQYFGTTNTMQAELAYNFHLCTRMWVSIMTKDVSHMWEKMADLSKIPVQGEWVNFLRNHDELSLAYLDEDLKEKVSKELLPNGAPFREGYGISGRTYALLNYDEKRFFMAYLLVGSIQGGFALTYGDEIGMKNIPESDLTKKQRTDSRNINRGKIAKAEIESEKGKRFSHKIAYILEKRNLLKDYVNVWPKKVNLEKNDKEIFAASYKVGNSELVILINLSNKIKKIPSIFKDYKTVLKINSSVVKKKEIELKEYAGVWLQK